MKRLVAALVLAASAAPLAAAIDIRKNVTYYSGDDADKYRNRLDLYLPDTKAPAPVVIFVHGGGWTTGIKDQYAEVGEFFASHGIAAAVINYRLSPKVDHPGHVRDVARAFAWVHAHIGEYGGRADDIFLCGHSAGGHLVALLATDPKYLQEVGASIDQVKGVIPLSGVYTITQRSALFGRGSLPSPEAARDASPIAHVEGRHPPFLILYGDADAPSTQADAERMAKALAAAGTAVDVHELARHNHMQMVNDLGEPGDPGAHAILDFITGNSGRQ